MTAVLERRFVWTAYTLTVRNTASGLRYEYPCRFDTAEAGLAFAKSAGIADVRVVG